MGWPETSVVEPADTSVSKSSILALFVSGPQAAYFGEVCGTAHPWHRLFLFQSEYKKPGTVYLNLEVQAVLNPACHSRRLQQR